MKIWMMAAVLPLLLATPTLRSLNLSNNKIVSLPDPEMGRFVHLRELVLHHNQLVHMPRCLGHLRALRKMDLSHNKLRSPLPPVPRPRCPRGMYSCGCVTG